MEREDGEQAPLGFVQYAAKCDILLVVAKLTE